MIRPALRRAGYDVTRFPVPGSLWETLGRVFRQERVALVVDVGAHKGEYGAFLREHGYRGAIRSFEPVPSSADEAVRRASSDPGWTVERRAIAAARGTLPIRVARASNLSSFRAPTPAGHARFGAGLDEHDVIEVEVVPLADVVDVLIDNVFAHTDDGIPVEIWVVPRADGAVVLTVEDAGPGLPSVDIINRGRSHAGSTGLGLDIVRRAALASGGSLELGRSRLGGALVRLVLGRADD